MKKTRIHRVWILFLLGIMACLQVRAQYMPVVFDKKYGDKNQIQLVCPLAGDEVAMVGKEDRQRGRSALFIAAGRIYRC